MSRAVAVDDVRNNHYAISDDGGRGIVKNRNGTSKDITYPLFSYRRAQVNGYDELFDRVGISIVATAMLSIVLTLLSTVLAILTGDLRMVIIFGSVFILCVVIITVIRVQCGRGREMDAQPMVIVDTIPNVHIPNIGGSRAIRAAIDESYVYDTETTNRARKDLIKALNVYHEYSGEKTTEYIESRIVDLTVELVDVNRITAKWCKNAEMDTAEVEARIRDADDEMNLATVKGLIG